jgi:hypothetical protein
MISFLFWNIRNNPIQSIVANLALRHEVDVLMLAECNIAPDILSTLNDLTGDMYYHIPGNCERIEIFSRFSSDLIPIVSESDKYTIRHLKLPETVDILISVVHLPSKQYISELEQEDISEDLSELIHKTEDTIGHSRTVLVGDLNMSPFENGVIKADGLNGTMSRAIAKEGIRRVKNKITNEEKDYRFFYNPMWNLLGDFRSYPPGTHYYKKSEAIDLRWYMLDQVLIRPDLIDYFDMQELKILTSDGESSFLSKNGIPKGDHISGHLPLIFKLNL